MLQFVVSVKDRAADVFNRPFFVPHRNVAVRDFTDEVNRSAADNPLNKHPDDFDLYILGTFDDNNGEFYMEDVPTVLVRAKDVLISNAVATA
ncbi:DNA binding protein vP5 [Microviridae sp.]|nr:DNA binding protein vP5 [Microviridae sp.]UOF79027.1 DNA binding protein vP5 [Microviridae sp.]